MPVDDLIRDLLATGEMNEDTAADLNRMLADYQAGKLEPEDAEYVQALHARLAGGAGPDPITSPEAAIESARLDGLTVAEWRDRALRAEAALAEVREQLASDSA